MSNIFTATRSLDKALADLRAKYDGTPERSHGQRFSLERMIEALGMELAERQERATAR